jgi:hypothetical protein
MNEAADFRVSLSLSLTLLVVAFVSYFLPLICGAVPSFILKLFVQCGTETQEHCFYWFQYK